jgi:hypothetical protein
LISDTKLCCFTALYHFSCHVLPCFVFVCSWLCCFTALCHHTFMLLLAPCVAVLFHRAVSLHIRALHQAAVLRCVLHEAAALCHVRP